MSLIATAAFVFLCGLTLSGLVASACELASGRAIGLRAPFVTRRRPLRSLALTAACGPLMLIEEGLAARQQGRRGRRFLALCCGMSLVWSFASGLVVIDIARLAGGLGG